MCDLEGYFVIGMMILAILVCLFIILKDNILRANNKSLKGFDKFIFVLSLFLFGEEEKD